jgi:ABC-2 type transport system ATP-binding protein
VTGPSPAPLIAAVDLRVDVDGVPSCDGLAFETAGERVLVLGAPRALFLALTGLLRVVRGALAVRGTPAAVAAHDVVVAGAATDPPMPPGFTVREYVAWSARLSGLGAGEARAATAEALERLQLGALAGTTIARLVPHARRATGVAAALEDPLGGLADEAAESLAKILVAALDGRAFVVLAPRLRLASPLALAADEAILATAGGVLAQGAPAAIAAAGARRLVMRVLGDAAGVVATELGARGATVDARGDHLVVDLGEALTTRDVIAICAAAGAAIVELAPLARALA